MYVVHVYVYNMENEFEMNPVIQLRIKTEKPAILEGNNNSKKWDMIFFFFEFFSFI